MESAEILDLLAEKNSLRKGHFGLPDGRHTDTDFRLVKTLQFPPSNRKLAYEIVKHYWDMDIQLVVAVRQSAILFAAEIARQLEARIIHVKNFSLQPEIYPGFEIHAGDRVLLVDDVLSDDISHLKFLGKKILLGDARLVGLGAVIDTSTEINIMNVRQISALQLEQNFWTEGNCPLCANGEPLEKLEERL